MSDEPDMVEPPIDALDQESTIDQESTSAERSTIDNNGDHAAEMWRHGRPAMVVMIISGLLILYGALVQPRSIPQQYEQGLSRSLAQYEEAISDPSRSELTIEHLFELGSAVDVNYKRLTAIDGSDMRLRWDHAQFQRRFSDHARRSMNERDSANRNDQNASEMLSALIRAFDQTSNELIRLVGNRDDRFRLRANLLAITDSATRGPMSVATVDSLIHQLKDLGDSGSNAEDRLYAAQLRAYLETERFGARLRQASVDFEKGGESRVTLAKESLKEIEEALLDSIDEDCVKIYRSMLMAEIDAVEAIRLIDDQSFSSIGHGRMDVMDETAASGSGSVEQQESSLGGIAFPLRDLNPCWREALLGRWDECRRELGRTLNTSSLSTNFVRRTVCSWICRFSGSRLPIDDPQWVTQADAGLELAMQLDPSNPELCQLIWRSPPVMEAVGGTPSQSDHATLYRSIASSPRSRFRLVTQSIAEAINDRPDQLAQLFETGNLLSMNISESVVPVVLWQIQQRRIALGTELPHSDAKDAKLAPGVMPLASWIGPLELMGDLNPGDGSVWYALAILELEQGSLDRATLHRDRAAELLGPIDAIENLTARLSQTSASAN